MLGILLILLVLGIVMEIGGSILSLAFSVSLCKKEAKASDKGKWISFVIIDIAAIIVFSILIFYIESILAIKLIHALTLAIWLLDLMVDAIGLKKSISKSAEEDP